MKQIGLLLVIAGLGLAVPLALAQATTFTLYAESGGADFVWADSSGAANPTISVAPSSTITATLISKAGFHAGKIGAVQSADFDAEGEPKQVTMTFASKASGSETLLCPYHTNMKSKIVYGTASAGEPTPAKKSPGVAVFGVSVALVGAALLLTRRK